MPFAGVKLNPVMIRYIISILKTRNSIA